MAVLVQPNWLAGVACLSPGHAPVARSNPTAPPRSIAAFTSPNMAPCNAAAARISSPGPILLGRGGSLVLVGHKLPDALEYRARYNSSEHTDQRPEWFIKSPRHRRTRRRRKPLAAKTAAKVAEAIIIARG